jgi:hypothetical protein
MLLWRTSDGFMQEGGSDIMAGVAGTLVGFLTDSALTVRSHATIGLT